MLGKVSDFPLQHPDQPFKLKNFTQNWARRWLTNVLLSYRTQKSGSRIL